METIADFKLFFQSEKSNEEGRLLDRFGDEKSMKIRWTIKHVIRRSKMSFGKRF